MTECLQQPAAAAADDFVIVERRENRAIVGMAGRCTIDSWRDAAGRNRRFSCEIQKLTPQGIALSTPVSGSVGDWMVAYFDQLGKFEGPIIQTRKGTLVMRIVATNDDRARLASTIAWMNSQSPDVRRFPRSIPESPDTTLSLAAGEAMPCQVINHSICGAAISTGVTPPIGTVVKIGQVVGRVVRHFGGGFAIAFAVLQDPALIESLIMQPAGSSGSAEPSRS